MISDDALYQRGIETALACWDEIARSASMARVVRLSGVAAAVFPSGPERDVYNNAVLDPGMDAADRARAIAAMEAAYGSAAITDFAAWVHDSDSALQDDLIARGYARNETTRAMGMSLDELQVERPSIDLGAPDWSEYLRILGVPGVLVRADPRAFHVLIGRQDAEGVATAMAFDHAGDCGIFNVTTQERARRRGLGTALTALHLHDARSRGCRTASLQSTVMAEHVYASVGFRDLGRILEFVPK